MTNSQSGRTCWRRAFLVVLGALMTLPFTGYSQTSSQGPQVAQIIDRIVAGERQYAANLKKYNPRVETYVQFSRRDSKLGETITDDGYFLGRLEMTSGKPSQRPFIPGNYGHSFFGGPLRVRLFLDRFVTSTMVDESNFDPQHYNFEPVGWKYLGDVRCLAIDVHPKEKLQGAFEGRIWVEDQNYAIVRLNGTRVNPAHFDFYIHFDSWRENLRPGEWLPVYIYTEEDNKRVGGRYKANTRLWGYDLSNPERQEEWAKILVESPAPVRDSTDIGADMSPVEGKRQLEMEAEQNVLWRLEKARLIAPAGPVDKVAETVLNNLVVTNHLTNLPPLHCRVAMTSTLESFPLRYTIVLSRGLLDVLPDEPSLAMVLAHELGHIVLGHTIDTKFAFNDRIVVPDDQILPALDLSRTKEEEAAADTKAVQFLENSPYKDKLASAGLFLRAAAAAAQHCPNLFGAHMGDRLATGKGGVLLSALMQAAPELQPAKMDQIAALPLGSRIQVNPWDGSIVFANRKGVALVDPSEKMPFQVSPLFPRLARYEDISRERAAAREGQ